MRLFQSTICVNEDREAWEPSLRVLLSSLSLHCPGMAISLFYPVANQAFRRWLSAYPQVQAADRSAEEWLWLERKATGHYAIARCWLRRSHLDRFGHVCHQGHSSIVPCPRRSSLCGHRAHVFAGSLRSRWSRASRATMATSRSVVFSRTPLNSGVLRATRRHYPLMKRWWELLQSDEYQRCQRNESGGKDPFTCRAIKMY